MCADTLFQRGFRQAAKEALAEYKTECSPIVSQTNLPWIETQMNLPLSKEVPPRFFSEETKFLLFFLESSFGKHLSLIPYKEIEQKNKKKEESQKHENPSPPKKIKVEKTELQIDAKRQRLALWQMETTSVEMTEELLRILCVLSMTCKRMRDIIHDELDLEQRIVDKVPFCKRICANCKNPLNPFK